MIKNHFKIAFRNLAKRRYYTALNVFGLVSGIAFTLLIAAYIWQEYQVNANLRNLDNQYILQSSYKKPGMGMELTTIGALPKALKTEYPHLVADYYLIDGISCIVSHGDKVFKESAALGAESAFLTMYGFELADGNAETALNDPFSAVITHETAIKYFGRTDVVGETLSIHNFDGENRDFVVTGVLKRMGRNSVINLTATMDNTIFLPLNNTDYFNRSVDNWQNLWIAGFVELQEGVTPKQLEQPLKQLLATHADEQVAANLIPVLKPLRTYYLDDNNGAVRKMMTTVSLISGFILLMAIINFINISVSQSISRLREIGVRKIMGSSRQQLTGQLLLESMVLVGLSAIISLAIYPVLKPVFANIMGKQLPELGNLPLYFYTYYVVGALLLGVLAGIYPALRLSANHILYAVKGQFTGIGEKHVVRKALLGLQFVVAMVVVVASVVISKQVALFFSEGLGYDKNYLLTAQVPRDWSPEGIARMETIRQELATVPQITDISISYDVPSAPGSVMIQVSQYGAAQQEETAMQLILSDAHYADTYKIPMLAGEFFSPEKNKATDVQRVVINNQAAKALGYANPEEAVGRQVAINGQPPTTIAGVTDDFYLNTMHSAQPAVVWTNVFGSTAYRFFSIRIQPGSIARSMAAIEKKWKELMPDAPFEYTFMDESLHHMYQSEMQLKKASSTATIISIIIVILGVIGLVSLTVQQRMKEVGIRKVLGASAIHIINLFVKDFMWVYVLALLLACPIAYYLLDQWLANYHKKTDLGVWVFSWPLLCLAISIVLSIFLQGLRVTLANPVDSLRNE